MAPISVRVERSDPPVGIVALSGEHDGYSAPRLETELALLLDSGTGIVVDLSDATFVDSQTLSVLLGARHQAEAHSLGFAVALPDRTYTQVHRILDMTGLRSSFALRPSVPEAFDAARAGVAASRGVGVT